MYKDKLLDIPGYNAFHSYRDERVGGGVSIFIKNSIKAEFIDELSQVSEHYESCSVLVTPNEYNNNKLRIVGVYRPPTASKTQFVDCISRVAGSVGGSSTVFLGDFNIDLMNEFDSSDLCCEMLACGFASQINIPTRETESSSKCIDHIWYNRFDISMCGSFATDVSDHYTIFSILDISVNSNAIRKRFRDHSENSITDLTDKLPYLSEGYLSMNSANVDEKTKWFIDSFYRIYDRCCPIKTKTLSSKKVSKPWISDELKRKINEKHSLFKSYKMGNIAFDIYNDFKNRLTRQTNNAKKFYFIDKLTTNRKNIKATWSTVNSMLNRSRKNPIPTTIIDGDRERSEPLCVANSFLDHFATTPTNIANSIPTSNTDPLSYMPPSSPNSFFVSPVTEDEVLGVIMGLKNKFAPLTTIPVFIYKIAAPIIAPLLCDIFSSSVREGTFPNALKLARVVPIFKSKNRKLVSNYRPISVLLTVSKIIEKLMKNRVDDFFQRNNVMYDKQFGFRVGYNTTDAILDLINKCTSALDSKLYTVVVFLDLARAFDTVDRDIMIKKLYSVGIRGMAGDWFKSYLRDRKMYVDVNGHHSGEAGMNLGLPQGSVTSPYLFGLYVNDMHRCSDKLSFVHFADDTTVFMSGDDLTILCQDINSELVKVTEWLRSNRLSLNVDKTNFMLITHNRINSSDLPININGSRIRGVRSMRFLGVTLDDRINYNENTNVLSKKLSCALGIMKRVSSLVTPSVLKILYYSLFYSHLCYALPIWGGCGVTNVGRIDKLNEKACKMFSSNTHGAFIPPNYHDIYRYVLLSLFHVLLTDYSHNSSISNQIANLMPHHVHLTRFLTDECLSIPQYRKTTSQNQFLYNAVKEWNELPIDIRKIFSRSKFKKTLKNHLYN